MLGNNSSLVRAVLSASQERPFARRSLVGTRFSSQERVPWYRYKTDVAASMRTSKIYIHGKECARNSNTALRLRFARACCRKEIGDAPNVRVFCRSVISLFPW